LLYVRQDGVAMAVPFDLDRLEITGEAVPVLEGVAVRRQTGFAPLTWSASGAMAFIKGTGISGDNLVVRVDRQGAITLLDTTWSGAFNGLALAPDGHRLAVGVGQGSAINIWLKDLDGGPFTRLTFGNSDRRPTWSPDGTLVAFVRDSASSSAVYGRPADGSGQDTMLARIDQQVQEVAWSPDGEWLVLRTDNATSGAGDLIGYPLAGAGEPVRLVATEFTELHPTISPDGRWLAYTSAESGILEVYVRPFPETGSRRYQVSNGGGTEPVWSSTGDELFFLYQNFVVMATAVRDLPAFQSGTPRPLFSALGLELDGFHQSFVALPDGSGFLFLSTRALAGTAGPPQIVWLDGWPEEFDRRMGN
jgi:serine/threonine-protein kinase